MLNDQREHWFLNSNNLRGLRITSPTSYPTKIPLKPLSVPYSDGRPTKSLNFKNEWELDLSAFEAIELNGELIQPTEDELEPDRAQEFDTSTLGSHEQTP